MKRILLLLAFLPVFGWAQPIDFSAETFDFQTVYYTHTDSMQLTIDNTTGADINVEGVSVFSLYDTKPFFVKDSVFTLGVGTSHDVWIYFEPNQNVLHQMYMVVHTDYRGDYLIELNGKGKFLKTYYSSTYNKSEQDLKDVLKTTLAQGYQQQTYNIARDNMYATIDNVNGDVTCVYTGRVATFNTRIGANANSFNCEHTFPQSFFSQNLPMRSDVHHLFSTDVNANGKRSNLPFGVVTGTPSWTEGGSKLGNGVFEPRDAQKGQVARALFYFVVRYQDYSSHVAPQESILRTWFDQFQPTADDIQRNEDIYTLQNNRNPFVDYPQFLKRISKISGTSSATAVKSLFVSRDTVDMRLQTESLTYTLSIVNNGNKELDITNFNISDTTNFTFVNAMNDLVLQPGQGMEIDVLAKPTSSTNVTEQLTFNTDATGLATATITLLGEWLNIGITENELIQHTKVYPNPTSQSVHISRNDVQGFQMDVFSATGQLVLTKWIPSSETLIEANRLPAGIYVVKTTVNEVSENTRLVIQ